MPTKFFLSERYIKKILIRSGVLTLVQIIIFFFLLPYFFSDDSFYVIMGSIYTFIDIVALEYWYKRWTTTTESQPVIAINETCIQFGFEQEGFRVPLEYIALAEIKKNFFGRKFLNIVYTKKLAYKIKHPLHFKMKFLFERRKARWSQKWSVRGLSVEPEVLVQSIHFHLERYIAMAEQYEEEAKLSKIQIELSKPEDRYNSFFFSEQLSKGKG